MLIGRKIAQGILKGQFLFVCGENVFTPWGMRYRVVPSRNGRELSGYSGGNCGTECVEIYGKTGVHGKRVGVANLAASFHLSSAFIEAVGAMFAAGLAALPSLEVVGFGEHDKAFFTHVEVFGGEFGLIK